MDCQEATMAPSSSFCLTHALVEIAHILKCYHYHDDDEVLGVWLRFFSGLYSAFMHYQRHLLDLSEYFIRGYQEPGDASEQQLVDTFVEAARYDIFSLTLQKAWIRGWSL